MEFTMAAQMALEAAPIGVVMVDDRGKIVLVNAEAERLFGYKREEILGQYVEMLVEPIPECVPLEERTQEVRAALVRRMDSQTKTV